MARDEWVNIINTDTGGIGRVHKSALHIWLEKPNLELLEEEGEAATEVGATTDEGSFTIATVDDMLDDDSGDD